jgi:glyoxylase-like metal-dependent hydrolase (beta-lactamase superfamily II)
MAIQSDCAWRSLSPQGDVRTFKYSWGPATANALAVRVEGGGWLVVSPPLGAPASAMDELADDGGITALLAPNAYHYLGVRAWSTRFAAATCWAPERAHVRLSKKCELPFSAAEDLARTLPKNLELVFPDGQKQPDLLLRIVAAGEHEVVWWLGDLVSNTSAADQIWPLRLVALLAGSGLGYRRNSRPELVYVRDRSAWLASVRRALEAHPPTVVVPAHGDPVLTDTARRTLSLF